MAYARFGNDSDIYMYKTHSGYFEIHIARGRTRDVSWPPASATDAEWAEFWKNNEEPLALPFAGQTALTNSVESALKVVEMLREVGYNVPEHTIERLREESECAVRN